MLDLDPLELKRGPDADEEGSRGAEESGEESERDGIESAEERRGEEEGDLSGEEREADGEEGNGVEVKRIEDIGDHEA